MMTQLPRTPEGGQRTPDAQDAAQDISLIAVMGVTGSGKSHFLRLLTDMDGANAPKVGGDLDSCTQKTESFECFIGGRQFVFFDTPGFDDTYRGDADVLADIAQALSSSYRKKMKLSGIVYLHRIKDERMTNAIMRNLTMFRSLCGDNAFKNVMLVTTFWDELPEKEKGEHREAQLLAKPDYWGYMRSKGSRVRRFLNSRQSALDILAELTGLPEVTLQIQDEMVNQKREIGKTTAGEALNHELAELTAKFQRELEDLQAEKVRAVHERDLELQRVLEDLEREKREIVLRLESEQAALQEDRREEQRRMEQFFSDQLLRLERDRKARQARIDELETRLSGERADSDRRFQEAMAQSAKVVAELRAHLDGARAEDRRRYEDTIHDIEKRQREARDESRRWRAEVDRLNKQIQDATVAQISASSAAEKKRLEERIQELEKKRKFSWSKLWSIVQPIASIAASVLIPTFL